MSTEPTRVVNIRLDEYDVYIGRKGRTSDGYFGNPFRLADYGRDQQARNLCLLDYAFYFLGRLDRDPEFRRRVLALRGKRLGCFCAPRGGLTANDVPHVCHGQVMAQWLDSQPENKEARDG